MNQTQKSLIAHSLALSLLAATTAHAAGNPFEMQALKHGYQVADASDSKMKDGKCGSGKCGAHKKDKAADKMKEGTCSAEKMKEGSCAADKMKEGSCSAEKMKEGSCHANK